MYRSSLERLPKKHQVIAKIIIFGGLFWTFLFIHYALKSYLANNALVDKVQDYAVLYLHRDNESTSTSYSIEGYREKLASHLPLELLYNNWARPTNSIDFTDTFQYFYDAGIRHYTIDQFHLMLVAGDETVIMFKDPNIGTADYSVMNYFKETGTTPYIQNYVQSNYQQAENFMSWLATYIPGFTTEVKPATYIVAGLGSAVTGLAGTIDLLLVKPITSIGSTITTTLNSVTGTVSALTEFVTAIMKPINAILGVCATVVNFITRDC